jgi:hypothetical protein
MKYLITLTVLTSVLSSGQASAWEGRHNRHHHNDANTAAALIGGLVLGAALADSSNRSSNYSSSTTYYSDYPTQYSSRTSYYSSPRYSRPYYSQPYYSERVYVSEPVVSTTYYSTPVREYAPPYRYPARKRVEHVYYKDTIRDEYGNCYSVNYRDGRKVLKEVPRHHCSSR